MLRHWSCSSEHDTATTANPNPYLILEVASRVICAKVSLRSSFTWQSSAFYSIEVLPAQLCAYRENVLLVNYLCNAISGRFPCQEMRRTSRGLEIVIWECVFFFLTSTRSKCGFMTRLVYCMENKITLPPHPPHPPRVVWCVTLPYKHHQSFTFVLTFILTTIAFSSFALSQTSAPNRRGNKNSRLQPAVPWHLSTRLPRFWPPSALWISIFPFSYWHSDCTRTTHKPFQMLRPWPHPPSNEALTWLLKWGAAAHGCPQRGAGGDRLVETDVF